jgi:hypothetical protein
MIEKNEPSVRARRERRRTIANRDARLRRIDREQKRLVHVLREAPLIELDEPYQRGWSRYFVLKPEARRRADAKRLREVAELVQSRQYCRKGDWMAWSHRRKRLVLVRHVPRDFTPADLLRKRPSHKLLKYFATEHHGTRVCSYEQLMWLRRHSHGGRLYFIYPHLLMEVVEPYMITHTRAHYPEIERRIDEIERELEAGGRDRLLWLSGRRSYRYWDKRLRIPYGEEAARQDMRDQLRDAFEHPRPDPMPSPITPFEAEEGAGDRAFFIFDAAPLAA